MAAINMLKHSCYATKILGLLILFSYPLHAAQNTTDDWADDGWGDDEVVSPWKVSGFIEGAYGRFTQNQTQINTLSESENLYSNSRSNSPLEEIRARINVNYSTLHFDITAKGELLFDQVLNNNKLLVRELNIQASPFDFLDIKIGKQVLTWGTADYLFINDLFPKDWQSFFSGRDDEYLKAPSNSVKISWFINGYTLDVVWTPEFTEDNFIRGERFSFYSPQLQQQIAPESFTYQEPNDEQWFTRLSTTQQGVEYALYGYKGRWTTPEGINSSQLPYFPKMNSVGASIRAPLYKGLFNAEIVNYNSIENTEAYYSNTYFAPYSQQRFLIGYETELIKNVTLNTQYYVEHTKNHAQLASSYAYPEQLKDRNRQLLTARLTIRALQQTLVYSIFTFYSPTDHDGYLKSSISYRQDDHWLYSVGANVFWGKEDFSFFGQHQKNSNIWAKVRYQF